MTEPESIEEKIAAAIATVESISGLRLGIHQLRWMFGSTVVRWIPKQYHGHQTAFCDKVKVKRLKACMKCDIYDLQPRLLVGQSPILRTCHAGADELIVPVFLHNELVMVIFLGQFRHQAGAHHSLPKISAEKVAQLKSLLNMLRGLFIELALEVERGPQGQSRQRAIVQFIDRQLSQNPALRDLAEHLSLSESRTSHLVVELMGCPFRELKEIRKIAVAKELLGSSFMRISEIAERVGVADPNYFSRYFRAKVGMSPSEFRRQNEQRTGV